MFDLENWIPGIDREWVWVIQVFIVVLATAFANFFVKRFLLRLIKRLRRTSTRWDEILVAAATRPLSWIVWLIGLDIAADMIYQQTENSIFT